MSGGDFNWEPAISESSSIFSPRKQIRGDIIS